VTAFTLLDRDQPEPSPRFDVTGWVLRLSAGAIFLAVGIAKFGTESTWAKLFAEIGLGSWFRYLTGMLQVVGGLLLIAPPTTRAGAVLVGCTMAGAVLVHLLVLDTGVGGAIIPAAVLIFVAVIALRRPD
jgi:putative oxidoreductase